MFQLPTKGTKVKNQLCFFASSSSRRRAPASSFSRTSTRPAVGLLQQQKQSIISRAAAQEERQRSLLLFQRSYVGRHLHHFPSALVPGDEKQAPKSSSCWTTSKATFDKNQDYFPRPAGHQQIKFVALKEHRRTFFFRSREDSSSTTEQQRGAQLDAQEDLDQENFTTAQNFPDSRGAIDDGEEPSSQSLKETTIVARPGYYKHSIATLFDLPHHELQIFEQQEETRSIIAEVRRQQGRNKTKEPRVINKSRTTSWKTGALPPADRDEVGASASGTTTSTKPTSWKAAGAPSTTNFSGASRLDDDAPDNNDQKAIALTSKKERQGPSSTSKMITGNSAAASSSTRQHNSKRIRVATYNVLCPALSSQSSHIRALPQHLHPPSRLRKIKRKLVEEVFPNNVICCLQEVGLSWKGELQQLCEDFDYKVIDTHYGTAFNDFMGIMVAYPAKLYKSTSIHCGRMSDAYVDFSLLPEQPSFAERLRLEKEKAEKKALPPGIKDSAVQLAKSVMHRIGWWPPAGSSGDGGTNSASLDKKEESAWDIVEKRMNRVIMVRFSTLEKESDGKNAPLVPTANEFAVATYHNPCLFGASEKVRALGIHTAMLVQAFQEFAGESTPRILLGDFNFTPTNSPIYDYITTASDESFNQLELLRDRPHKYHLWNSEFHPLDSCYALKQKKEPRFTNYASRRSELEEHDFMETLDYVFVSKNHWEVESVVDLLDEDTALQHGVQPNEAEPSDHCLVGASLLCRKF
ncbi:unnamed protein product [Amoebophrya sp. A120]|nr:unnamed protein product [Amoebophrya sp. A120]|eukprot:GSA120T00008560001.1